MKFITNEMGWPSEYTRARQIADALGCEVDVPVKSYDEPVVLVKVMVNTAHAKRFKNLYLDYIDDPYVLTAAKLHPHATLIALTDLQRDALATRVGNDIVVIPEHTCNFAQQKRTRKKVQTVGYVGSPQCFDLNPDVLGKLLNKIGLKFLFMPCTGENTTRRDVVNFYKKIDIQVGFRLPTKDIRNPFFRNPLKVFNAGSFGIPTVAYPEISYSMCAGSYFLEAVDLASIVDKCWRLAHDEELYQFYADRVFTWSKQFDIANVAKQYAKLAPNERFDIEKNVARMRKNGSKKVKKGSKNGDKGV